MKTLWAPDDSAVALPAHGVRDELHGELVEDGRDGGSVVGLAPADRLQALHLALLHLLCHPEQGRQMIIFDCWIVWLID